MEPSRAGAAQSWSIVIAAGIVMGAALGVRHTQGLFMQPVLVDQGWTREAFGFAVAVQNLLWGLAQPFTGMLADRYGSARVIFVGMAVYALGLVLMAQASTPTAFTLTNGLLIGLALSGTAFGTVYAALSRIFAAEARGWALAVAGAVGGLGQFAMVPAVQSLLSALEWTTVCLVLGATIAALSPLAVLLREPRRTAHDVGETGAASVRAAVGEAFSDRGFWLLNTGFFACGFQLAFIATHLPAYLSDQGLTAHHAALALACIALANVFGMYYAGRSVGVLSSKNVLAGVYLVRAVAMLLFISFPVTAGGTYAFAALMGFLWLGTAPLTNALVVRLFGTRYVATLFGFVFFGHQLGSFLGVWLGGYVYDVFQSYELIWLVAIAAGLVAAVLHLAIDESPVAQRQTVSELQG